MDTQKLNLVELDAQEMVSIDGGGWIDKWLKKVPIAYVVTEIIENWDEVKEGFMEGYNDATGGN